MPTAQRVTDLRDLDAAFTIRERVFVHEQGVPAELEYDAHDRQATTRHYLAHATNGTPAGAARWRETENGVKLERFAVLPDFRNQEVGAALLKQVVADVRQQAPGELVYLHAQLRAVPFYERHGFARVGELFEEAGIQHYKMALKG
ncbi:GNAT family N-acetyltransferase [uncultured Hymenobacter sp.]|uniref:GNAT family N-acetyltransferase n=1 Tax=uncultured Hymenobacter sp. TaxID=170016 RepID=UPI0035C961D1